MAEESYPRFTTPVNIHVTHYRNRGCDFDAPSIKAVIDGIVALGILSDDGCKEVESCTQKVIITKGEEKTIIEIEEVNHEI